MNKKRTNGNFIPNIQEPTAKDCVNVADQVFSAEVARLMGELVVEVKKIGAVLDKLMQYEPEQLSARLRQNEESLRLLKIIDDNTRIQGA